MENASSSDYLAVKKRKHLPVQCPPPDASAYTANKQYVTLQTTAVSDDQGCLQRSERFDVKLGSQDLATLLQPMRRTYPMFSFRKWIVRETDIQTHFPSVSIWQPL